MAHQVQHDGILAHVFIFLRTVFNCSRSACNRNSKIPSLDYRLDLFNTVNPVGQLATYK